MTVRVFIQVSVAGALGDVGKKTEGEEMLKHALEEAIKVCATHTHTHITGVSQHALSSCV